jgi:hypothetical protein
MNAFNVALGVVLLVLMARFVKTKGEFASFLYKWYNNVPDPSWRPSWLPWQFRPTLRQCHIMVYALMAAVGAIAFYSLLTGLGVL